MSKTYSDLTFTSYPDACDSYEYMQDMTSDLLSLVSQYESLINAKDFGGASQLLLDNPQLNRIYFNAEKYNRIIDSVKAIQRLYFSDIQKYLEQLIVYRGDYVSTNSYSKYDVVLYNNSFAYLCISDASMGINPTDRDHFVQITLQGETGSSGLGLAFVGAWSSNFTYSKDDAVSYGTCLYASNQDDNTSHTPSKNSSFWNLIIDFSDVTAFDNSSSETTQTTMQSALEELYSITDNNASKITTNTNNISTNTKNITSNANSIANINNRISNINNTPDSQKSVKNADTVDGVHFHPNDASGAPSGHGYVYGFKGGDDLNAWVFPTNQMSVNYANSSGTASSCSGNAATATTANYAHNAGNSDTVDGYHFMISTADLTPGSSSLTTNMFYFVYE